MFCICYLFPISLSFPPESISVFFYAYLACLNHTLIFFLCSHSKCHKSHQVSYQSNEAMIKKCKILRSGVIGDHTRVKRKYECSILMTTDQVMLLSLWCGHSVISCHAPSLTRCERAADVTVGVFHRENLTDISTILSQRSCKLSCNRKTRTLLPSRHIQRHRSRRRYVVVWIVGLCIVG